MIVCKNTSTKMLVLKTVGKAPLRLIPGFNSVDEAKDLSAYTKGNKAAEAMVKDHIVIMKPADLKKDEQDAADKAKAKNDKLNKSAKVLKGDKGPEADK